MSSSTSTSTSTSSTSSAATSLTIKKVKNLKESLIEQSSKENHEQILDLLSHLDQCPIDVNVLAETLVGASVAKLKSNSNADVSSKARALVKKWKQVAKQSRVVTNKSSSSASASASTSKVKPSTPAATKSSKSAASSSSSAAAASPPTPTLTAWDHLPDSRKNAATKLYQTFHQSKKTLIHEGIHTDAISSLTKERATEVEEAIQKYSKGNRRSYMDKIRALILALRKNQPLRNQIILGQIDTQTLVYMSSKELQTDEKKEELMKKVANYSGSKRLDWEQANEHKINQMCGITGDLLNASLFTCGRCKSIKTTSTQKQTRSADEPMTVFVLCLNCGNRWKC